MLWISISQTIVMPDRNHTVLKSEQNKKCSWYKCFKSTISFYWRCLIFYHHTMTEYDMVLEISLILINTNHNTNSLYYVWKPKDNKFTVTVVNKNISIYKLNES